MREVDPLASCPLTESAEVRLSSGEVGRLRRLRPELAASKACSAQFRKLAEVHTQLDHPSVVRSHGLSAGRDGWQLGALTGRALSRWMQGRALPPEVCVHLARQVLTALAAGHAAGLVHRDVRPDRVWVQTDGRVVLSEFGVWGIVDARARARARFDHGLLDYDAPEAVEQQEGDARGDLFMVGAWLYELLAGVHPFRAGDSMQTSLAIASAAPVPLGQLRSTVPERLGNAVQYLLSQDPEARFQSAVAARNALSAVDVAPIEPAGLLALLEQAKAPDRGRTRELSLGAWVRKRLPKRTGAVEPAAPSSGPTLSVPAFAVHAAAPLASPAVLAPPSSASLAVDAAGHAGGPPASVSPRAPGVSPSAPPLVRDAEDPLVQALSEPDPAHAPAIRPIRAQGGCSEGEPVGPQFAVGGPSAPAAGPALVQGPPSIPAPVEPAEPAFVAHVPPGEQPASLSGSGAGERVVERPLPILPEPERAPEPEPPQAPFDPASPPVIEPPRAPASSARAAPGASGVGPLSLPVSPAPSGGPSALLDPPRVSDGRTVVDLKTSPKLGDLAPAEAPPAAEGPPLFAPSLHAVQPAFSEPVNVRGGPEFAVPPRIQLRPTGGAAPLSLEPPQFANRDRVAPPAARPASGGRWARTRMTIFRPLHAQDRPAAALGSRQVPWGLVIFVALLSAATVLIIGLLKRL